MTRWFASALFFGGLCGLFTVIMLAQISDNAVEDAVHSEYCCKSHGGCPNGVVPECQVPDDGGLEYRVSAAFRDGIAGMAGFAMFVVLFLRVNGGRVWSRIVPGSIILPLSLCLIFAQLYVWIWRPPLFD